MDNSALTPGYKILRPVPIYEISFVKETWWQYIDRILCEILFALVQICLWAGVLFCVSIVL